MAQASTCKPWRNLPTTDKSWQRAMAQAGDVICSKYRLIHPLGIGGMGTVWRAEHIALKQHVAIKLMDVRGPAADRAVKRFQREAQIAASIHHRNIVYISDFGNDQGAPYLVMELLNGVPLSERMVVGEPMFVATFLRMVEQTLQGLSAVHAAGVVHRDMKPENIFLVGDGDVVYPKLLDFGVSRSTERGQGHTITREGIVMGTPEYVSPEQARGRMADARSDIYSLGVVMYEALAGRLPFHADNAADLIVAVLNAVAIPLHMLRPDVGPVLSGIVGRSISREPNERYPNCEEMREAILDYLAHHPEAEQLSLPKRFINPSKPQQDSEAPTVSEEWQERPLSLRATNNLQSIVGRRRRKVWLLGSVTAASVALIAMTALPGDIEHNSARAASIKPRAEVAPAAVAEAPAPEAVSVELLDVPENAQISVDGMPVASSTISFLRGSGIHSIRVERPGVEPWQVEHDAANTGRYTPSFATKSKPAQQRREPSSRVTAFRPGAKTNLLRKPDF